MDVVVSWLPLAFVTVILAVLAILMHAGLFHSVQIVTGRPPVVDESLRFCYTFALGESAKRRRIKRLLLEVEKLKLNLHLVVVHYDERDKIKAERRRYAIGFIEHEPDTSNQQAIFNGNSTSPSGSSNRRSTRNLRSQKVTESSDSARSRRTSEGTSEAETLSTKSRGEVALSSTMSALRFSRMKLNVTNWPPICNSVFCEFPFRSRLSHAFADWLMPSRISAYTNNRRLSAYPLLEVRPTHSSLFARLLYVAPLAKQDAFFVEEAVIRKR